MEARNRSLPDWFTRIRTRQIKLPRFQRFEAWGHYQVTALLNTVLQELPAGAVLTLDIGEEEPFVSRTVVGAPTEGERVTEHLLDGQQRLTALWRSLTNNYTNRNYYVKIEEDEETGNPFYAVSYSRWEKNNKTYPLWLNNPVELWNYKYIPVQLLCPNHESESELKKWAKEAANNDMDSVLEILEIANRLRLLFSTFNIPFLSLPSTTSKETALNVFIQMNTSSSPLSAYDIVVAQVEAGAGQSLHDLIDELKQQVPEVTSYIDPADLILSVSALLVDKPPTKSTYLSKQFSGNLVKTWERACVGIQKAITFLEEEKIFDNKRLPTDIILAPLSVLWSYASDGLDAEGETRIILRKYIWRAFFTDRYERTTSSRSLVDCKELKKFITETQKDIPTIFNEEEFPLPKSEEFISAGWPIRKDRFARAILALSLKSGGVDFADGSPVSRVNLAKREYHHLFPDAWLSERGLSNSEIYRALNCGLITWKTNRNISAKSPDKYIGERLDASSFGEEEIIRRLNSHLIPYNEIKNNDYDAFILRRAEEMHAVMKKVCNGESL